MCTCLDTYPYIYIQHLYIVLKPYINWQRTLVKLDGIWRLHISPWGSALEDGHVNAVAVGACLLTIASTTTFSADLAEGEVDGKPSPGPQPTGWLVDSA